MANELSKVRTYFDARIAAVDSDFRAHGDGFNFDNIPRSTFDKAYHLLPVLSVSTPLGDKAITDTANWELRLLRKGFRDPQAIMDEALDTMHLIRIESIKPANAMQSDANIKQVVLNSYDPQFVPTNDNAIIILMSFSVELIFSGCG